MQLKVYYSCIVRHNTNLFQLFFHRLYMIGEQVAQKPDANRISACVCIKLSKEFQHGRNRSKDRNGRNVPVAQSIILAYSHIRQLIEDCRELRATNLVLVPINNTTINNWRVSYLFLPKKKHD